MENMQRNESTELMYYILLSLTKESDGYGIVERINERTQGRVKVGAGTLYSLLVKFEKEEIIFQVEEKNKRSIFKLTEKGQELLKNEFSRLQLMVNDTRKVFDFPEQEELLTENGGEK